MLLNDNEIAYLDADCRFDVRFAIRNDATAKINRKAPTFVKSNTLLPVGIKEHYKITEIQSILGKAIVNSSNDLKYLPSAMLIGDFSCTCLDDASTIKITKRKKQYKMGEKISDFGKIELLTRISVPVGATGIEIVGTKLYTILYLNNKLIGEKIASPYIFSINKALCGKEIDLKIVQISSIAPLFGNVDYWDKNVKLSGWRGTPSTQETMFGFKEINWILKKIEALTKSMPLSLLCFWLCFNVTALTYIILLCSYQNNLE